MNPNQIDIIEKIIEKNLLNKDSNLENLIDPKNIDIVIKYLIYWQLKEINLRLADMDDDLLLIHENLKEIKEKLKLIDETLVEMANPGMWENE
jgi:hypothetical protein